MTVDRRKELDPTPPDGVEHRSCADRECRDARDEWFMKTLLPALTVRFIFGIVAAISILSGASYFVTEASIARFELRVRGEYELITKHDNDMDEIKLIIRELNTGVAHSMTQILNNQDTIIRELEAKKR